MKSLWIAASLFLILAGSWFAFMEFALQHPGFQIRAIVSLLVVLYAALSLLYTRQQATTLRHTLTLGAVCGITLGCYAVYTEFRTTDFEGYILLVGLGLITQGVLTLAHTLRRLSLRPV